MRQPYARIRLAKAALLLALDEWPDIDVPRHLARLDRLAKEVGAERTHNPRDQWSAMRTVLVERHGFTGNKDDYQNPDNSYLNRVLETGRGIPISLSVIWLDVARWLEWPVVGIGIPGHFMLRHQGVEPDEYIDPFHDGELRTRRQCQAMLRRIAGADAKLTDETLEPVDNRHILRRMLGNLYACYVNGLDWRRSANVLTRMMAVDPDELFVQAELARVLTNAGQLTKAGEVLDAVRKLAVFQPQRNLIEERSTELQRRIIELN